MQYAVLDPRPGSPSATVRIVIKDGRGVVVRRAAVPRRKIEAVYVYRFRCDLARGVYVCIVSATDAAGNRGPVAAAGRLVVH